MNKQPVAEAVINVIVVFILVLACAGVLSAVMWYKTAREAADLKLVNAAYSDRIQKLNEEIADKRHKIKQANSLLSVAYPNSRMDFLSE